MCRPNASTHGATYAVLLLTFGVLCISGCWGPESPARKSENAFLLGSGPEPRLVVKRSPDGEYCAAGIWSKDADTRIWTLIQPASDPPKILPQGVFEIHPGDEVVIARACGLDESAADQLRTRFD